MSSQNGTCKLYRGFSEFRKENGSFIEINIDEIPNNKKAFIAGKWGTGKTTVLSLIKERFGAAYPTISISNFTLNRDTLRSLLTSVEKLERVSIILIDNLNIEEADNKLKNEFIEVVHRLFNHFVFISIDSNNLNAVKKQDEFGRLNEFEWIDLDSEKSILSPEVEAVLTTFGGSYYLAGAFWEEGDQTERFLDSGIWEHGFKEALELVKKALPGDVIFLKSSFAQGSTPILRIKAVGRVVGNNGDGFRLTVEWKIKNRIDIADLGHYRTTFAQPSKSDIKIIIAAITKENAFDPSIFSPILTGPTNISSNINLSNKLKNSGEKVRNDVAFPDGPYDIINKSFVFTVFPQTQFWRFGLRMSRKTDINFDLGNPNRHANPAYRDIHISAGSISFSDWAAPENLELNQYYIPNRDHVLNRWTTFKPLSSVIFRVTHLADDKVVEVAVKSQGCAEYVTRIPFDEFRFFKVFAWADMLAFDLDFILEVISIGEGTAKLIEGKYTPPDKWYITEDEVGVIGVQDLAGILGNLLKNLKQTDKGKMIGIFGPWGRGKTFLVDHTWKLLEQDADKPFIRINFHAWKYQDTPASWAYLYETFAEEYFRSQKKTAWSQWWDKLYKKVDLNWKREGPAPFLFLLLSIATTVLCFIFGGQLDEIKRFFLFFGIISVTTLQVFRLIKNRVSEKAKELFDKYYSKVSFSNLLGTQAEIQRELRLLLQQWLKEKVLVDETNDTVGNKRRDGVIEKRILLFVDDIDRCKEDRIMEIIDALRVMLEDDEISKRVVVVAAIDERVLKRAIKCKYHDILDKDSELTAAPEDLKKISGNITREYMDKLFLSGISLGSLSETERVKILGKYIRGRTAPRENIETYNNVIEGQEGSSNQNIKQDSKTGVPVERISDGEILVDDLKKSNASSEAILKLDDAKYDLTKYEEEYLAYLMAYCTEFTPRQIRIFYYRYLLGRNILKLRFEKSGKHLTRSMLENLARLILNFSIEKNIDALKNTKTQAYAKEGTLASVEIFKSNEAFLKNELIDYLEIIETVVSY